MNINRRAVTTDHEAATREEAAFFGEGPDRMFGYRHLPPEPDPRLGVVVCSPFQTEIMATYRWEVLLGRHLAQRGFAVQRFHYRGTGNSDGDSAAVAFDGMVDDAVAAAASITAAGVASVAFAGAGFGGLVAAGAAAHHPGAPLVLRGPAFTGKRYFRDAFRAQVVSSMRDTEEAISTESLLHELQTEGTVDIVGTTVPRAFYDSAVERTLQDAIGAEPRPVLLMQANPKGVLSPEAAALTSRLRAAGFAVDALTLRRMEMFWVVGSGFHPIDELPETRTQLEAIADWLERIQAA
ncbi:MAG: serine aminopeptidase domain-containing protein [Acidimicrobiia bacterium]